MKELCVWVCVLGMNEVCVFVLLYSVVCVLMNLGIFVYTMHA